MMTEENQQQEQQQEQQQQQQQQQVEYDKTQQQIDQERANARRAREQADQYAKENEQLKGQVDETKEQIEQLNQKLEGLNRPKLDPNAVDIPDVAQYAQTLEEQIQTQKDQLAEIKRQQQTLSDEREKEAAEKALQKTQEMILSDCDQEHGAQYRNEALKLADQLVDSGDEKQPQTELQGYKLMQKCYKQVAAKKKPEPQKTAGDSGGGTVTAPEAGKPGTFEEVLADMKKTKSWRTGAG